VYIFIYLIGQWLIWPNLVLFPYHYHNQRIYIIFDFINMIIYLYVDKLYMLKNVYKLNP
jgi:hypothetical protein